MADSNDSSRTKLPDGSLGVRKLLIRDSNHLGKAFDILLRSVEILLRVLVATSMIMLVNWKLTVVIVPLLVFIIPLFYRLHTSIKRDSDRFFNESSVSLARVMRSFTDSLCAQNVLHGEESSRHVSMSFEQHPVVYRFFHSFRRILLARDRVKFATASFSSAALGLVLLVAATLVSYEVMSWGETLAYLMAFWILLTSLRQLQGQISGLAFFYPALLRMISFLEWAEASESISRLPYTPSTLELVINAVVDGSQQRAIVHPGDIIALESETPLDRGSIDTFFASIRIVDTNGDQRKAQYSDVCFLGKFNQLPVEIPVGALITLSAAEMVASPTIESELQALGLSAEIDALGNGLDTPSTLENWSAFSEKLKFFILNEAIRNDRRPIVFIDTRWLAGCSDQDAAHLLSRLDHKLSFLVTTKLESVAGLADHVAFHRSNEIIGFGDVAWGLTTMKTFSFERQAGWLDVNDEFDELG